MHAGVAPPPGGAAPTVIRIKRKRGESALETLVVVS
jgi:hypothetical protein